MNSQMAELILLRCIDFGDPALLGDDAQQHLLHRVAQRGALRHRDVRWPASSAPAAIRR